ncbi:hypothetical protein C4D60_Mb11t16420 [Musa balbisiana]|uniref:Uncharacterized protein n=1 Tax=Musa balbisiana TaxID=52838 RepID=A0A4S8J4I7_MUSBA|nr:hypothetical protein C4D60_Mb11t16420 [Musa balbisiana]
MTASTKRCEIIWTIYYSVFSPVASEEARERARPREYNSEVVGRGERARKEHRRGRYRARRLPFDSSLQQPRRRSPDRRLQFVDLLHGFRLEPAVGGAADAKKSIDSPEAVES